jgi:hypothetical protein
MANTKLVEDIAIHRHPRMSIVIHDLCKKQYAEKNEEQRCPVVE